MKEILKTDNLCKYFKKQKAVDNVSITVRENSIYGLLGPNGAGKSTTLKMITGMLRPTSGKVLFNGHEWNRKDLEQIGALIETPPLYENLSAVENLEVRAKLLNIPKTRIDKVLKMVDLQNTGRKKAGQFSMGMKQRLGIAIALLNSPKLLILDEPTNGLDPIGIQELRSLIRSFPSKGITVILSSHILSEVQLIADDIGIISNGILGYEGQMNKDENLENLFVEVVGNHRRNDKMKNYISSEYLKHKNTFAKKLVWLAPILTLCLNILAPMWYQQNSYNWWYVFLYPGCLTLLSILIIQRDNGKLKFRAILSLPVDLKKV